MPLLLLNLLFFLPLKFPLKIFIGSFCYLLS
nr:MAG TPA: hypothetical protein [Caudoviricetes sp.]